MFRRHRTPPLSPLEQARLQAQADLKTAQERFAAAQAAKREAGRLALSLAERRQRTAAVRFGKLAVDRAQHRVKALNRDPAAEAEYQHDIDVARSNTIAFAREAAQLLKDHFDATGDKPGYTFSVKNVKHQTAAQPDGVDEQEVKGWLLFNEADSHDVLNYPTLSHQMSRWVHFYHGPVLLPNGEIRAFYNLEEALAPGVRPAHHGPRGVNLKLETPLQTMDYERYRGFYRPEEPILAEFETQQAIADLLEKHGA